MSTERKQSFFVFTVCVVVFIASPVTQFSDSTYSLLVSECLLKHGTISLNRHVKTAQEPAAEQHDVVGTLPYQLLMNDGRILYRFPIGSSILSVPFVAIANVFNMSAIAEDGGFNRQEERRMQVRLAALLMAVFSIVLLRVSRRFLGSIESVLFTLCVVFTTQVWTTASRALWSHTWAILLVILAIDILTLPQDRSTKMRPLILGCLTSMAYLTRPTMAIAIAVVFLFLILEHRKEVALYAATVTVWFAGFMAFSWKFYGSPLPAYFHASRLSVAGVVEAALGCLFSPSRGLLVFLPYLILVGYLLVRYRSYVGSRGLVLISGIAVIAHIVVVSMFPHWWGGHGYGPRLLTDAIPWVSVVCLVSVKAWLCGVSVFPRRRMCETGILVLLLVLSLTLNSPGALSEATNRWNREPTDIDEDPARLWDWQDPQFLAPITRRDVDRPLTGRE